MQGIMKDNGGNRRVLTYFSLFIIVELIMFTVFNIINLVNHGGPVNSLMLSFLTRYDDYFAHLGFASAPFGTNIYEYSGMACFPPLAYLMYAFLARVTGYRAEAPEDTKSHQNVGNNLSIYVLYTIVCVILIVYAVNLFIKKKGLVGRVVFPFLLIMTYPFAYSSIQRGNSVLLVAALLSIALAWRNDESKIKREIAMILIAVCAGLKIYPAIFGLLYLKEKRFKETIRLVIYGLVLFFVPFLFFGGIEGFKSFLDNILALTGSINRCSVAGSTEALTKLISGMSNHTFNVTIQQIFLIACIAAFFMTKDKWGEVLILCAVMTVYISSGWMYTCVYILPAMLVFFLEKGEQPFRINRKNLTDIMIMLLFFAVFSMPYLWDYPFIYDSITIIVSIYAIKTIVTSVYRKGLQSYKPV